MAPLKNISFKFPTETTSQALAFKQLKTLINERSLRATEWEACLPRLRIEQQAGDATIIATEGQSQVVLASAVDLSTHHTIPLQEIRLTGQMIGQRVNGL